MIISIIQFPDPVRVPGLLLLIIFTLATISIAGNKIVGGLALTLTASWALIRYSAPMIKNAVSTLNQNAYVSYDTSFIITIAKVFFISMPIMVAFAIWRVKENKKEVQSEINTDEEKTNPITAIIEAYNTRKFTKKFEWLDLEVCKDVKTNQPVILKGLDRYLHQLISGSTGCGKTSRVIKPQILQDLMRIKNGQRMSIVVVEPSGDLAQDVADICKELNIPCVHVDPMNPDTAKFNILQGNATDVAETTRTVLKELFGKQEAFFAQVQETAARNTILLLKRLYGDDLDLTDVVRTLRDIKRLETQVNNLKAKEGETDLVQYFENELLAGEMRDKYKQFAIGLRQQLEDIVGNDRIKNVITGNSSIDLDKLLAEGGVFVVNSALELGTVGDTFGKFVIGQMKAAIWRRPGNEWTRIPCHFVIDEFPVYVNDDFRRILGIGRKYRVMTTLAVQTLDDIVLKGGPVLANIFMQNCRNKIVFGGMTENDAIRWEKELGKKEIEERQASYENKVIIPSMFAKNYRVTKKEVPRIPYTKLMELKEFQFIYRLVKDSRLQPPGQGKGSLISTKKPTNIINRIKFHKKLEDYKTQTTDNLIEKTLKVTNKLKNKIIALRKADPIRKREVFLKTNKDNNESEVSELTKPCKPKKKSKIVFIVDKDIDKKEGAKLNIKDDEAKNEYIQNGHIKSQNIIERSKTEETNQEKINNKQPTAVPKIIEDQEEDEFWGA